ncbi:MAG: hypothetical protein ACXVHL_38125, partial [Solirubrobacteraceae bacterium]
MGRTGDHVGVIDEQVRELHSVLAALGLPSPEALADRTVLDEIDRAIAPLRLPESVRRLWELVDPYSLTRTVGMHPEPSDLQFSLESWRRSSLEIHCEPRHFFQFCYSSH